MNRLVTRLVIIVLIMIAISAPVMAQGDGKMTDAERAFLVEQLELSKKNFLARVSGLTIRQWRSRPSISKWTSAECAEHIILAVDYLFESATRLMNTPASSHRPKRNAEADAALVASISRGRTELSLPRSTQPKNRFVTPNDAIKEFSARFDSMIGYARVTQDELRAHDGPYPSGRLDVYQCLLLIAAHTNHHTQEIVDSK